MKAEPIKTEVLKEYWESVRQKWEKADYEKDFGYKTYKGTLLKRLDGVKTSLEIGFGDGRWMKLLRGHGIDAYGIDILENAALVLRNEGIFPVISDARQLPFKNDTIDLVYSFGVVEHFEETEKAIEEHVRVAQPGARIIITVPYLFSPLTVYWMLFHVKRGTFKERPATFGKRYTLQKLKSMLQKFDVKSITLDPFLFPIPKFRRFYHENPLLNRFGLMIWAEMTKS